MLRMRPVKSGKQAEQYYARTDGGYYHEASGLRCEWGGRGAMMLGLAGPPEFEQFRRVVYGLDPRSGEQLTAKLVEGRIPGWDVTASVPKGVTVALERGDSRIQEAIWQAGREAMSMLEQHATTRVRVGGQQADRRTGNLLWYAVEHAETRPALDDTLPEGHPWRVMPDMDRHIHFFVSNLTHDAVEDKWKAVKFRPIMDLRRYFDRAFESLLAKKMADLGYELETKWKPDARGGSTYFTWDIQGIPASVIAANSRRSAEVDQTEADILAELKEELGPDAPERLSAVARDQLGATTRRAKREDVTLSECRDYWDSRFSEDERRAVAATIERAMQGEHAHSGMPATQAVAFAIEHHSEQRSVIPYAEIAITAMERSLGSASPAAVDGEIRRQAMVTEQDGELLVTTEALQAEEDYLVHVAQPGRGVAPVGVPQGLERGRLNAEQWQAVCGLLNSPCRVNLLEGPAGAGKSSLLSKFDEGMRLAGEHVAYLATTAASAEVLKEDGFAAHTLAHFLLDEKLQSQARGGRVVIDETSMLGHKDAVRLFRLAEQLDLKLICIGDPLQHGAVPRGAFHALMKRHAGLHPFTLTQIQRQQDLDYRTAAQLLARGETQAGLDVLEHKGWVREIGEDAERYRLLAEEYLQAQAEGTCLVVSPTHAEAAKITEAIRSALRQAGKLGETEREFTRLVAVSASQAERGQAQIYEHGPLVLQFHQNAKGGFVKGDRLLVSDPAQVPLAQAEKFSLYRPEAIGLSVGDKIRFTGTVKTIDGKHTLKNGATRSVAGFHKGGIRLDNGWVVGGDCGHFRLAFCETSFGSQGQTHRRVVLGMAAASAGAMNQEQLYVSATRGRTQVTIYTDDTRAMREAVARSSAKRVALDLRPTPAPQAKPKPSRATLLARLRQWRRRLRQLSLIRRTRAAWEPAARKPQQHAPQAPPPPHPYSHAEREWRRHLERQQRENTHGR